jgi:N-acyl-D-aspartate/D-glutamate deacylase
MKTKLLGIKLPDDSDIAERMRVLAKKKHVEYWELLAKWIAREESEDLAASGQMQLPGMENVSEETPVMQETAESQLAARIAELEQRLLAVEQGGLGPVGAVREKAGTWESTEDRGVDGKAAVVARILELSALGLSTRRIADTLAGDGVPTFSGAGKWQGATVAKILQKAREAKTPHAAKDGG